MAYSIGVARRELAARRATSMERGQVEDQESDLQASYEYVSECITVVTLVGLVHVYNAPVLRQLMVDLVNHGRVFLVVDMAEVEFFDSTGTGVLISTLRRVRDQDGGMALVVPSERIQKWFRITGLIKVFPIFDTVDPAVEFLGRELGTHG